jgi:Methyltransferase domain
MDTAKRLYWGAVPWAHPIRTLRARRNRWRTTFQPPGHFYSPIPSVAEVRARAAAIFDRDVADIPGVELDEAGQLALLARLAPYVREHPWREEAVPGLRFRLDNPNFGEADPLLLHALLRHGRPRRAVEVGCGYSSCVFVDTNERFLGGAVELTFVEPYPELFLSLLAPGEREAVRLHACGLQAVPDEVFDRLEAGDVLFVDSSHVSKTGSDVNHLFFRILPRLAPGVWIHLHDVPFPFEYPEAWVYEGRAWNECYLLRAFLQYNGAFQVLLWGSFLAARHRDAWQRAMPPGVEPGGSIWLRKR